MVSMNETESDVPISATHGIHLTSSDLVTDFLARRRLAEDDGQLFA